MSRSPELHPWPMQEHCKDPSSTAERVLAELHGGARGAELRDRILREIGQMNMATPLAMSFDKYNHFLSLARGRTGSRLEHQVAIDETLPTCNMIGCYLAMHTYIACFTTYMRKNIRAVALPYLTYRDDATLEPHELEALIEMARDTEGEMQGWFNDLPEDLKCALLYFAQELFCDYSEPQQSLSNNEFLLGYVFALTAIDDIRKTYGRYFSSSPFAL